MALVEAGFRTILLVPMLRNDELVGAFAIGWRRIEHVTENEIELVTDFAAQAAIALEITGRERQFRELQMELAHVNRVATIGHLTASITHEVNQPLAAARNNLTAALNFVDRTPPDLVEAREALACAVKDSDRASTVVGRIRALMQKAPERTDRVNINEALREVIELTQGEALKNGVSEDANTRKIANIIRHIADNSFPENRLGKGLERFGLSSWFELNFANGQDTPTTSPFGNSTRPSSVSNTATRSCGRMPSNNAS